MRVQKLMRILSSKIIYRPYNPYEDDFDESADSDERDTGISGKIDAEVKDMDRSVDSETDLRTNKIFEDSESDEKIDPRAFINSGPDNPNIDDFYESADSDNQLEMHKKHDDKFKPNEDRFDIEGTSRDLEEAAK